MAFGYLGNFAGKLGGNAIGALLNLGAALGGAGAFIGGVIDAIAGAAAAQYIADQLIDSDNKKMMRIISFEMEIYMGDFLCTPEEADIASKKLNDILADGKKFQSMQQSSDKYIFAQNIVIPVLEETAASRAKVELPEGDEYLLNSFREIIEAEAVKASEQIPDGDNAPQNQIVRILQELDVKPKNQQAAAEESANPKQEVTLGKVRYDGENKQEAINWMFTFLRILIKEKCPEANERILVPSAKFGEEIPAYFDGTIDLDNELQNSFGLPKSLLTASNDYATMSKHKQNGTLRELAECVCDIINKIPDSKKTEAISSAIVDEKYSKHYSEKSFWDTVTSVIKKAGSGLVYKALQLFYAMQNPECTTAVKAVIITARDILLCRLTVLPILSRA